VISTKSGIEEAKVLDVTPHENVDQNICISSPKVLKSVPSSEGICVFDNPEIKQNCVFDNPEVIQNWPNDKTHKYTSDHKRLFANCGFPV